mmetsp:Transcript_7489/g.14583  ORF Transcript_7489/g.14583 Transcript_7489/m.14583 type:complete len:207 (-) Transcript_7489:10-630(-)
MPAVPEPIGQLWERETRPRAPSVLRVLSVPPTARSLLTSALAVTSAAAAAPLQSNVPLARSVMQRGYSSLMSVRRARLDPTVRPKVLPSPRASAKKVSYAASAQTQARLLETLRTIRTTQNAVREATALKEPLSRRPAPKEPSSTSLELSMSPNVSRVPLVRTVPLETSPTQPVCAELDITVQEELIRRRSTVPRRATTRIPALGV